MNKGIKAKLLGPGFENEYLRKLSQYPCGSWIRTKGMHRSESGTYCLTTSSGTIVELARDVGQHYDPDSVVPDSRWDNTTLTMDGDVILYCKTGGWQVDKTNCWELLEFIGWIRNSPEHKQLLRDEEHAESKKDAQRKRDFEAASAVKAREEKERMKKRLDKL